MNVFCNPAVISTSSNSYLSPQKLYFSEIDENIPHLKESISHKPRDRRYVSSSGSYDVI